MFLVAVLWTNAAPIIAFQKEVRPKIGATAIWNTLYPKNSNIILAVNAKKRKMLALLNKKQ
jgi:hypothetical protein